MSESIRPVPHGGIDYDELARRGVDPETVVDLSSNILWTPPAATVRQAIAEADIASYPDRDCGRLRDALAQHHRIDAQRTLVGNGCCDLIHLLAASHLRAGDDVLIVGPTFGEYERASRLTGANVHSVTATADDGFRPPLEAIDESLQTCSYALVWICSPNNPTGQPFPVDTLRDWIRRYPRTVFAVDESYLEFSPASTSLLDAHADNLIVLRSMTKYYALAGVRLGYAVAPPSLIGPMRDRRLPWSVNTLAQAAGAAALAAKSHYDAACERMRDERSRLRGALSDRGLQPCDTDTSFLLLPVDHPASFRDRLLDHGVLVRDVASMGLEQHVRIAVGDSTATDRLLAALDPTNETQIQAEPQALASGPTPTRCDATPPTTPLNGGANGIECQPNTTETIASHPIAPARRLPPQWDPAFRDQLHRLFQLRRDVRRFHRDPLPRGTVARLLEAARLAPSVGLSEPWRFLAVDDPDQRQRMVDEFETANARAADAYDDQTATHYRKLKLAGLREAPEHLAVFVDADPQQGRGLGRQTMPETVSYSVVAAIQNFWLAARAEGIGVGWVSILRPERVAELLEVPSDWQLIAYLCIGYPLEDDSTTPELQRQDWERRREE